MSISETYNMDCMEYMKNIEDNYFDVIITSPPYNLGNSHNNEYSGVGYFDNLPDDEYIEWQTNILNEFYRIIKKDGSVLYNHKNITKDFVMKTPYRFILKSKLNTYQEILWNKLRTHQNCEQYLSDFTERIYWMVKDRPFFNKKKSKIKNTIIEKANIKDISFHSATFSIELVKDLLSMFNGKKIKVFDPFLGSGSSRIAAYELGFDFVGCELDKDYFNDQELRFKEWKMKFENKFYIPDDEMSLFK